MLDPDRVRERGDRPLRVVRELAKQVVAQLADLLEGEIRRVRVEHPRVALQDLRERPVGHALAIRKAPPSQDDRAVRARLRAGQKLRDEATLPDSRVAVDRDEVGSLLLGDAFEHALDQRKLTVASDHRRADAGDASLGPGRFFDEFERANRGALALEREVAELAEPE